MGEFKNPSEQQNKTAAPIQAPEEVGNSSKLAYVDTRSSTAQLISLQAAADGRGNRSTTTQLQAKAWNYAGNSRIAQLQALADARTTAAKTAPIQRAENKTGLPDQLKSGMESISGLSLNDVKVHRNSDKPAQLQAHAYAQGTDIHLGPGQEKHLPHELGHVVQQKQGRVKPTVQLKGKVNINDDPGLEKEADVLGAKALQGKFITPNTSAKKSSLTIPNQTFQLAKESQGSRLDGPDSEEPEGNEVDLDELDLDEDLLETTREIAVMLVRVQEYLKKESKESQGLSLDGIDAEEPEGNEVDLDEPENIELDQLAPKSKKPAPKKSLDGPAVEEESSLENGAELFQALNGAGSTMSFGGAIGDTKKVLGGKEFEKTSVGGALGASKEPDGGYEPVNDLGAKNVTGIGKDGVDWNAIGTIVAQSGQLASAGIDGVQIVRNLMNNGKGTITQKNDRATDTKNRIKQVGVTTATVIFAPTIAAASYTIKETQNLIEAGIYLDKLTKFGVTDPEVKRCVDLYKFKAQKTVAKTGLKVATGATLAAASVPTAATPVLLLAGTLFGMTVPAYESMSKTRKWFSKLPNPRKESVSKLFDLVKDSNSEAIELCKAVFFNESEWLEIEQLLGMFNEDVEAAKDSFIERVMSKTK